ncbi:heterokaryon incompatibility protein-domain-containing protein [Hypoxylon trugodes]|uniref:heterokaryon incompatibility protein-domain-containing protein n=1 Tax=Hypoxylon trugodes TaxID=326681 RepID=UPI0021950CE2|nr:heterokaryon incompatibility protein-domain-containing protein [Hypoxylon trugodes]KAI1386063.1 heterokaryon incompatibility protein-domain-containing protein [Hypoxylon trugodes]
MATLPCWDSPVAFIRGLDRKYLRIMPCKSNNLCSHCKRLRLSTEKFMINDNKPSDLEPSLESLRLANERFSLKPLRYLKAAAKANTCELCSIVSHTVPNDVALSYKNAECHLVWEIDGRDSAASRPGHGRRIRRLRVRWYNVNLKQYNAYLVLAAPSKFNDSDLGYRDLLGAEAQFLGRRLGRPVNKQSLIRAFLQLCEQHHHGRCAEPFEIGGDNVNPFSEPYFGVINIEDESLGHLPKRDGSNCYEEYATVSYSWGKESNKEYRTTTKNVQQRLKSGGMAEVIRSMPKALRSSVWLVHVLGIKYIWIDAICIVQDSSHSWNLNALSMHLIYGSSMLTICAADGENADAGLVALKEKEKPPVQVVATCAPGVDLILHQSPEASIENSTWNRRAWTFQERLLSKRCLIFRDGRIYFQCRSTSMSEDIFAEPTGCGWSLDLIHSPLQMLSQLKDRSLWFYIRCVSLYTLRELSEPFDILAAFSGMCKFMQRTSVVAPFIFGLPSSHFDFALLWQPVGYSSRLTESKRSNEPKYKDMKFPTWSWCGWKSRGNRGIRYRSELVDGCLSDVCAWHSDHTWIDWHIRDGYGTLRRVWDRNRVGSDRSENVRWRGYMGSRTDTPGLNNPYGRRFLDGVERCFKAPRNFALTLPEDPYHVRTRENGDGTGGNDNPEFPDQPFLQFFTWRTTFHVVPVTANYVEEELCRCHIMDQLGDKCGSILVDAQWLKERQGAQDAGYWTAWSLFTAPGRLVKRIGNRRPEESVQFKNQKSTKFRFIAISEAKSFTEEEFPDWTYYIPKERSESEWDLFYVLLVEESKTEGFEKCYHRVALGKVFKAAFSLSKDEWTEIILG